MTREIENAVTGEAQHQIRRVLFPIPRSFVVESGVDQIRFGWEYQQGCLFITSGCLCPRGSGHAFVPTFRLFLEKTPRRLGAKLLPLSSVVSCGHHLRLLLSRGSRQAPVYRRRLYFY